MSPLCYGHSCRCKSRTHAFLLSHLRWPFFPRVPWLAQFPETNVRTYVRGPNGERGVWFFTFESDRVPAVLAARTMYHLPGLSRERRLQLAASRISRRRAIGSIRYTAIASSLLRSTMNHGACRARMDMAGGERFCLKSCGHTGRCYLSRCARRDALIAIRFRRYVPGEWSLILTGIAPVVFGVVIPAAPHRRRNTWLVDEHLHVDLRCVAIDAGIQITRAARPSSRYHSSGEMRMRLVCLLSCLIFFVSCSGHNTGTTASVSNLSSSPPLATYMPRIGVAVITGSRACIAIHNANVTISGPVTLVSPMLPQSFTEADVSSLSPTPCPISKEVDPTVTNYDLHIPQGSNLPKLIPLIAVVGTSGRFSTGANNNVLADLDANGKTESFRACSADDGIHATVWSGSPLDGTLLWHGYYYEPGNTGAGPVCTPKEMPAS